MKDPRKDLFVLDDTVYDTMSVTMILTEHANDDRRPGILVLINESDWSLEGEAEYEIQPKDHMLISCGQNGETLDPIRVNHKGL